MNMRAINAPMDMKAINASLEQVQGLLALTLVVGALALQFTQGAVPDFVIQALWLVLGFFFGARVGQVTAQAATQAQVKEIVDESRKIAEYDDGRS